MGLSRWTADEAHDIRASAFPYQRVRRLRRWASPSAENPKLATHLVLPVRRTGATQRGRDGLRCGGPWRIPPGIGDRSQRARPLSAAGLAVQPRGANGRRAGLDAVSPSVPRSPAPQGQTTIGRTPGQSCQESPVVAGSPAITDIARTHPIPWPVGYAVDTWRLRAVHRRRVSGYGGDGKGKLWGVTSTSGMGIGGEPDGRESAREVFE
jgi:hypothetical protein